MIALLSLNHRNVERAGGTTKGGGKKHIIRIICATNCSMMSLSPVLADSISEADTGTVLQGVFCRLGIKSVLTLVSSWVGHCDLFRVQQCQTDQQKQLRDSHCTYTTKTSYCKLIGSSCRAVMNPTVVKQFIVWMCWLLSCFLSLSSKHAFVLANLMLYFGSSLSVFVCFVNLQS